MNVAVLISGTGSNLQAIIGAIANDALDLRICVVLSDKANALGLSYATAAGIPTLIIESSLYHNREDYGIALREAIEHADAQLVILAGFMRVLSENFVNHFLGRLINIHPSLLPQFPGLNTHQRVLDARCEIHGASVHFVTPKLDAGPIIAQGQIKVENTDTVASLTAKVLKIEHRLYPLTLTLISQNRIKMDKNSVTFDDNTLERPLQYNVPTDSLRQDIIES